MATTRFYAEHGRERLIRVLSVQHACVGPELQLRLAEHRATTHPPFINPDVVSQVRRELLDEDEIVPETATTRGGYQVTTYRLGDHHRAKTAARKVAARKRALHARYRSWAEHQSPSYPRGRIGPALERVAYRYFDQHPAFLPDPQAPAGDVHAVFSQPVPGGALDLLVHVHAFDGSGRPQTVTLLIETKNQLQWFYPRHHDLHSLLYKAAMLQHEHQDHLFVPMFLCRRRHQDVLQMGKDLGFYPIEVHRQPLVAGGINPRHLDEVTTELGYDLVPADVDDPLPRLGRALANVPSYAFATAQTWRHASALFLRYYEQLRNPQFRGQPRDELMAEFRREAHEAGYRRPWTRVREP